MDNQTAYSRINPDSPWRWVPMLCGLAWLATLGILTSTTGDVGSVEPICYGLLAVELGLGVIVSFRAGFFGHAAAERAWRLRNGWVRVQTHRHLALAMKIVGPVLVLAWASRFINLPPATGATSAFLERFAHSTVLGVSGWLITMWGWSRPWDLKVVERATPGTESA